MKNFKAIKKHLIEMIDLWETKGFTFILDDMWNEFERTGRHYATTDCTNGTCGYPRVWFGKCVGQYKDAVLHARLRKIYS